MRGGWVDLDGWTRPWVDLLATRRTPQKRPIKGMGGSENPMGGPWVDPRKGPPIDPYRRRGLALLSHGWIWRNGYLPSFLENQAHVTEKMPRGRIEVLGSTHPLQSPLARPGPPPTTQALTTYQAHHRGAGCCTSCLIAASRCTQGGRIGVEYACCF